MYQIVVIIVNFLNMYRMILPYKEEDIVITHIYLQKLNDKIELKINLLIKRLISNMVKI